MMRSRRRQRIASIDSLTTGSDWAEYASRHGLQHSSMEAVEAAERYARGSADYGAKWAYTLAHRMARR